jgi:cell division protein FtsW
MNAFGISGLTPIKGISVPFLSYGGSSMLAASIGIGMVLMISKKIKR